MLTAIHYIKSMVCPLISPERILLKAEILMLMTVLIKNKPTNPYTETKLG